MANKVKELEQKRSAHTSSYLKGWEEKLWLELKDCDSSVPNNVVAALNSKYPNADIPYAITYRELYKHMEAI